MSSVPTTICPRCNQLGSEAGKCAKCGTPTQTLASAKRRGWVAFGAGGVLVVFVGVIWIWVDRLLGAQAGEAGITHFLGRMNLAFGLIVVSGLLGAANGWLMAKTGRRNRPLIVALVIVFIIALVVAYTSSTSYQPS